ncbi:MAG: OmpH family outer membrane protein [Candidatus Zixiibacteriota bacterium]
MLRMRHALILLFTLALMASLAGTAGAQATKIGFVKDEEIKQGYKAWTKAQEQWELERKTWDEQAQTMQTELQELVDQYDKQKLILSDDKKKEKEAAIRAKQEALDAFTKQIYGPGGTAERKQQELIGPLLEKVSKAIEAVAVEGGFDVIFTMQSGLGYIKETYDVTAKVLEQLDKLEQ